MMNYTKELAFNELDSVIDHIKREINKNSNLFKQTGNPIYSTSCSDLSKVINKLEEAKIVILVDGNV